jgi:hypothetical protein
LHFRWLASVFCQEAGGGGTIHIASVEAADLEAAVSAGEQQCIDDWSEGSTPDESRCNQEDMSLSSCNLLTRIITKNSGLASCPNALTIDNRSGRPAFFPNCQTGLVAQGVVNLLPMSQFGPESEVVIAGLPMWQVVGHHAPGAARPDDVEDAIDNMPPRMLLRTTAQGVRLRR